MLVLVSLKQLAIIGESTVEDILEHINYWMTDGASDNDPAFEELGLEQSKLLKCCAHIILGVDNAADNFFVTLRQKLGCTSYLKLVQEL